MNGGGNVGVDSAVTSVQTLVELFNRMGLAWRLLPGTVSTQAGTVNVPVVIDGDDQSARAQSLVGVVAPGQRVMVMVVPPQGNYIIGYLNVVDSSSQQVEESAAITSTSTSFTATATVVGVAFIAPPSGKVWVHWHTEMQNNTTAAAFCLASFEVREGSTVNAGTIFLAGSDTRRLLQRGTVANADTQGYGSSYLVTGLTPHASYNVVHLVRVTAGTGQFGARRVGTSPG